MILSTNLPRFILVLLLFALFADQALAMFGVREQRHDQADVDDRWFEKRAETYASDNDDRRDNSVGTYLISDGAGGAPGIDRGLVVRPDGILLES